MLICYFLEFFQYAGPLRLSSGALMEDEKLAALGLSDQLPSAQGLFQATPSQSPFSVSQVWSFLFLFFNVLRIINFFVYLELDYWSLPSLQLSTPIPNIGTHVIINQKLSALGLHLHFQRFDAIVILIVSCLLYALIDVLVLNSAYNLLQGGSNCNGQGYQRDCSWYCPAQCFYSNSNNKGACFKGLKS